MRIPLFIISLTLLTSCRLFKDNTITAKSPTEAAEAAEAVTPAIASGKTLDKWRATNYFERNKCSHLSDKPFTLSADYLATNHVLLNMLQRISELQTKEKIDSALANFGAVSSTVLAKSDQGGFRALFVDMGLVNILVFRGTNNILEGLLDAKYFQVSLSKYSLPGKAHSGFVDHYDAIRSEVIDRVKEADSSIPLIITGHSLGGAVSYLAAMDFSKQQIPIAGVYTSGAPRLGDDVAYRYAGSVLRDKFFRLEHSEDVVPHAPPLIESKNILSQLGAGSILTPAIDIGVQHANFHVSAGKLISFNNDGLNRPQQEVDGDIDFWRNVAKDGLLSFPVLTGLKVIYHIPRNYICTYSKVIMTSD